MADIPSSSEKGSHLNATEAGALTAPHQDAENDNGTVDRPPRGFKFWAIIAALCLVSLLAALENTVVATSLPTIVERLQIGKNYIWITNVFFLTSAAVQPLFGQLATIFGRRWLAVSIVATFTVGSAICGAAPNGATLIAGRAIQGIGSGGINMLSDVIVSDLVPLRERGNFIAIVLAVYAVGTSLGPFTGGIVVEKTTWRWVFLITLPFGVAAILLMLLFLRVKSTRISLRNGLSRIDLVGNGTIILSTLAILIPLTYVESPYPWTSWRTLVPLLLGFCGFISLPFYEASTFCKNPLLPLQLFTNRTSVIVYIITFINSMLLYWITFFLPVYFQSVQGSSPARTGVQMLPIVLTAVPGAVIAVILLTKYGRYRPLHQVGFAIGTLGGGLFIRLNRTTPPVQWILYQIVGGLGSGMILNTLLPAFQACHPEKIRPS